MAFGRLIAALPPDFQLTVVDVGSAGGLNRRWNPFRKLVSAILFDPREPANCGDLGRGHSRTYSVALGAMSGADLLYRTALPNMSSFLRPDQAALDRYWKKGPHSAVEETLKVPVEQLDVLASSDGFKPDVLKVDTQGSEMLVLNGAADVLARSVLIAEIEVSFFERYAGQPQFADVEAFMRDRGFELIELHSLKRYRAANSLGIRNVAIAKGQRPGRIAYGDAIFLRGEKSILQAAAEDGGVSLLRAIVALVAYGKPDVAARLLDDGRECLHPQRAEVVGRALRSIASPRGGLRYAHAGIEWLARRV